MPAVPFYEKIKTTYRKFHSWACFCHSLNPGISLLSVKEVVIMSGSIRKERRKANTVNLIFH